MSRFRVFLALAWLLAAATAPAAGASHPEGERTRERPPQALLTEASTGGAASAARLRPSPSPLQEAQGLAFLEIPVLPRPSAEAAAAESSVYVTLQRSALLHPQRGPPLTA